METRTKLLLSLLLIGVGTGAFFLFPDVNPFFLFPIFVILFLATWAVPAPVNLSDSDGGSTGDDPLLTDLRKVIIGVGLSVMAAAVVALLPFELFWLVIVAVLAAVVAWWLVKRG